MGGAAGGGFWRRFRARCGSVPIGYMPCPTFWMGTGPEREAGREGGKSDRCVLGRIDCDDCFQYRTWRPLSAEETRGVEDRPSWPEGGLSGVFEPRQRCAGSGSAGSCGILNASGAKSGSFRP